MMIFIVIAFLMGVLLGIRLVEYNNQNRKR